ncbi:hypothetical protein ABTL71_19245, partial [Acinetobacter baumannii]
MILAIILVITAWNSQSLPSSWGRIKFGQSWYEIESLDLPEDGVVVLGNGIGFIAPAVPKSTAIIGLGTNFFFA